MCACVCLYVYLSVCVCLCLIRVRLTLQVKPEEMKNKCTHTHTHKISSKLTGKTRTHQPIALFKQTDRMDTQGWAARRYDKKKARRTGSGSPSGRRMTCQTHDYGFHFEPLDLMLMILGGGSLGHQACDAKCEAVVRAV